MPTGILKNTLCTKPYTDWN